MYFSSAYLFYRVRTLAQSHSWIRPASRKLWSDLTAAEHPRPPHVVPASPPRMSLTTLALVRTHTLTHSCMCIHNVKSVIPWHNTRRRDESVTHQLWSLLERQSPAVKIIRYCQQGLAHQWFCLHNSFQATNGHGHTSSPVTGLHHGDDITASLIHQQPGETWLAKTQTHNELVIPVLTSIDFYNTNRDGIFRCCFIIQCG